MFPALAGGFLTAVPPGNSQNVLYLDLCVVCKKKSLRYIVIFVDSMQIIPPKIKTKAEFAFFISSFQCKTHFSNYLLDEIT